MAGEKVLYYEIKDFQEINSYGVLFAIAEGELL